LVGNETTTDSQLDDRTELQMITLASLPEYVVDIVIDDSLILSEDLIQVLLCVM
jgi:hypothetical protein